MDQRIIDYVLSLNMDQVRSQLTLRSLPRTGRPGWGLRAILAFDYQKDFNDGWWLNSDRHMLLKHATEHAGVTQETFSIIGSRLGYITPVDEPYVYELGLSGIGEELPLILRPDDVHEAFVGNFLGMDVEIQAILADMTNNDVDGPQILSARTLYCRPRGGNARLVFGLKLEGMHNMGLIYCQLGRDPQGQELYLSGDVGLYPRAYLQWPDENVVVDSQRFWRPGGVQEDFERLRRGGLQQASASLSLSQ